jgi:hypothetical protein
MRLDNQTLVTFSRLLPGNSEAFQLEVHGSGLEEAT